ncbi:hypothetical protein AVEN_224307-1 [Araneus ventricosus]|uniref:DNA-directed DNA polymerase n=1 Tax=Araneus ventricosus TaxID=182803 RepID=A0A4Y2MAQ2_ARAVE|nr:hypothetical protein AVEN_224307-1 [Araneus ventricosus]
MHAAHAQVAATYGAQPCYKLNSVANLEDKITDFSLFEDFFPSELPVPYVIYADFESIITPNIRQVNAVSLHEPCGYCYVVIEPDGKSVKPPTAYREIDAAKLFVSSMLKEEEISSILKTIISLSITTDEEKLFKSAVNCHICGDELRKDRVRDHDHWNEQSIRGGYTITKQYAQANNKSMSNFDPSNPSKYILYFDANNLYGWAMSQALSLDNFKWESLELWNEESIIQIPDEGGTGFFFKVDLE